MRLVYKKYVDGTFKLYSTDERGRNEQVIDSNVDPNKKVNRVPVYIEVSCDDDQVDEAREGLNRLSNNLQKT